MADDCTKKLEAEVFRLQKRIARLEQENIDLRIKSKFVCKKLPARMAGLYLKKMDIGNSICAL